MRNKTPEKTNSHDTLNLLRSNISFPLLSKAGKAMKVNLPRYPHYHPSQSPPKPDPDEVITFERVQEELKRISEAKLEGLRNTKQVPLSSCFKTVSRSSNTSPLNLSPPPTRYSPRFDFLNAKIKGSIAYHKEHKGKTMRKTPTADIGSEGSVGLFSRMKKVFTPSPAKAFSRTPMR